MKKNRGFTLIELLAVILILGIIALIAIPTVNNIIIESKKGAFHTTANNVISALEDACALENLKGETLTETYTFTDSVATPELNMKGKLPTGGTASGNPNCKVAFTINSGQFTATKNMSEDSITVLYTSEIPIIYNVYANGTEVYFNPVTGLKCDLAAYSANTGASNNGTKTGCMKWYAFNDEGSASSSVNMILDHNTKAMVAWSSIGSNAGGMKEVATALTSDTSTWVSALNPRLITANEVATITGKSSWTLGSNYFYFASKTNTQLPTCISPTFTGCTYKWLYDRTAIDSATVYGSLNNASSSTYGYWTSSIYTLYFADAWFVYREGYLSHDSVGYADRGVRPVITVLKTIIS